jgi:outer membrane protein assembly factor BamA
MKLAGSLTFLLFAATAPSLAAPPPADFIYTAGRIVFNHPGPYSQAQLEAAAEIHTGTKFKMDDLGNAAQRLIDTGYFANVGATVSGDVTKINVLFDIQPFDNSQMIHIGYENFVWLTRAEIEDALRATAP